MATPTELAREANLSSDILRSEFDFLRNEFQKLGLNDLRERASVTEEKVARLEKRADADRLPERVALLESQLADTKKAKEEAEKRRWQFVYIFVGSVATLLVTIIAQLVMHTIKK